MTSPRRLDRAPRGAFTPAGCLVCSRGRRASLAAQGVRCRGAAWLPRGVGGLSAAARSPQAAGAAARRRDRSGAGGRLTPDWQPAPLLCATGDGPAGPRWPQSPSRLRPNCLFALSGRCAASFLPSSRFPGSLLRARPVRGPNHTVATPSYE